jgi:cholesterol transport system auxiliary component
VRLSAGSAGALPLLCLCLAGCSGLFQSKAKPEQIYYLRAPAAPPGGANSPADAATSAAATPAMPVSIRVVRPGAGPGLGSSHIMLVQPDHRMNFFSGSRWTAPTPEVIEALAVETLRASGTWSSVEGSASPFPADYLLHIHVQRFEADYGEGAGAGAGAPVVHVVLECIVGRREGREVLATFTASGSAAAAANRLTVVVSAFEQAAGTALEALARQAEQAVREDVKRAAPEDSSPRAGGP